MALERPLYELDNGVVKRLFVRHKSASKTESIWQIVVPNREKEEVLDWFHDKWGHGGVTMLADRIREAGLYWTGYYKDVVKKVKECRKCAEHMISTEKVGPMEPTLRNNL